MNQEAVNVCWIHPAYPARLPHIHWLDLHHSESPFNTLLNKVLFSRELFCLASASKKPAGGCQADAGSTQGPAFDHTALSLGNQDPDEVQHLCLKRTH